ncbi:hypothetical protein QAD02_023225 [Eretmocerus hayati]|uniref:Uncharacterized protein n=1 Tax=Eretmocerus hayati TaxID=131215 RepID=A0ACC2PXD9_9HYME|nr:hypothetical protein QAD02_023225 [Eretmocerus hayati]
MQPEKSKVVALRKADRLQRVHSPDRSNLQQLDLNVIHTASPKRKPPGTKTPMSPASSTLNLRKVESENITLDLDLAYSEYVASCAQLILEKKILKDAESRSVNLMKKIHEETKSLEDKCNLILKRIGDVKLLSCLDNQVDIMKIDLKEFTENLRKHEIQSILQHLMELLNRFNILLCENISLPVEQQEVLEFQKLVSDCCTAVENVKKPSESEMLENITRSYEEFIKMSNEISSIKKIIEGKMFTLQTETLKACSNVLSESEVQQEA